MILPRHEKHLRRCLAAKRAPEVVERKVKLAPGGSTSSLTHQVTGNVVTISKFSTKMEKIPETLHWDRCTNNTIPTVVGTVQH